MFIVQGNSRSRLPYLKGALLRGALNNPTEITQKHRAGSMVIVIMIMNSITCVTLVVT